MQYRPLREENFSIADCLLRDLVVRCKCPSVRGTVRKTPVAGNKDRQTNQIRTEGVESTKWATTQGLVVRKTEVDDTVYTDEHAA